MKILKARNMCRLTLMWLDDNDGFQELVCGGCGHRDGNLSSMGSHLGTTSDFVRYQWRILNDRLR